MSALPVLALACVWALGCSTPLRVRSGLDAPASAPADPDPYLGHHTCPQSQLPFDEAATRVKVGPPAVPGDDGAGLRLSFVDGSVTFDVVRLTIESVGSSGNIVLYVADERALREPIALPTGPSPELRLRAIVKPSVSHGVFKDVSVCFEKGASFSLKSTDHEIPLRFEDGDDATAPGQWALFRIDAAHLDPPRQPRRWGIIDTMVDVEE